MYTSYCIFGCQKGFGIYESCVLQIFVWEENAAEHHHFLHGHALNLKLVIVTSDPDPELVLKGHLNIIITASRFVESFIKYNEIFPSE